MPADQLPAGIEASDCLTPFGNARATVDALLGGRSALEMTPVLGDGGDPFGGTYTDIDGQGRETPRQMARPPGHNPAQR